MSSATKIPKKFAKKDKECEACNGLRERIAFLIVELAKQKQETERFQKELELFIGTDVELLRHQNKHLIECNTKLHKKNQARLIDERRKLRPTGIIAAEATICGDAGQFLGYGLKDDDDKPDEAFTRADAFGTNYTHDKHAQY